MWCLVQPELQCFSVVYRPAAASRFCNISTPIGPVLNWPSKNHRMSWIGGKSYMHPTDLTAAVWLRPASSSSAGVKVLWLRPAGCFQLLTARCGDTHPESDGADGRGAADSSWVGLVLAGSAREQQWLIPCEASCESHFHSGEPLFFSSFLFFLSGSHRCRGFASSLPFLVSSHFLHFFSSPCPLWLRLIVWQRHRQISPSSLILFLFPPPFTARLWKSITRLGQTSAI